MLTRRLIVCLDVKGGRVVKGVQFEGLRDVGDPVELAAEYYRQGADETEVGRVRHVAGVDALAVQPAVCRGPGERVLVGARLVVAGGVEQEPVVRHRVVAGDLRLPPAGR